MSAPRTCLAGALVFLGVTAITGCNDVRVDTGTDARFLHTEKELFGPKVTPKEPLLPLKTGTRWTYQLVTGDKGLEEQTVAGTRVINGVTCFVITAINTQQHRREEYYVLTPQGISQLGGGSDATITMNPPIPVVEQPIDFGHVAEWQGGITVNNGMVPGRAWSGVRGFEEVTVPAGRFRAYRVDSAMEATIDQRLTGFITTRWMVPGIGIVKTRYIIRQSGQSDKQFVRELVRYSIPK